MLVTERHDLKRLEIFLYRVPCLLIIIFIAFYFLITKFIQHFYMNFDENRIYNANFYYLLNFADL